MCMAAPMWARVWGRDSDSCVRDVPDVILSSPAYSLGLMISIAVRVSVHVAMKLPLTQGSMCNPVVGEKLYRCGDQYGRRATEILCGMQAKPAVETSPSSRMV